MDGESEIEKERERKRGEKIRTRDRYWDCSWFYGSRERERSRCTVLSLQAGIPYSPKASTQQVKGPGAPLSSRMPRRKDSVQEEILLGLQQ